MGTQLGPLFKRKDPLIRFAGPLDDVVEASPESVEANSECVDAGVEASPEFVDAGVKASPEFINAGIRLIDSSR